MNTGLGFNCFRNNWLSTTGQECVCRGVRLCGGRWFEQLPGDTRDWKGRQLRRESGGGRECHNIIPALPESIHTSTVAAFPFHRFSLFIFQFQFLPLASSSWVVSSSTSTSDEAASKCVHHYVCVVALIVNVCQRTWHAAFTPSHHYYRSGSRWNYILLIH